MCVKKSNKTKRNINDTTFDSRKRRHQKKDRLRQSEKFAIDNYSGIDDEGLLDYDLKNFKL